MTSSDRAVHALASHDEEQRIDSVLLWNFSASPAQLELALERLPKEMLVRQITLDAMAPSSDENARLRPEPSTRLPAGTHRVQVRLEPYAIKFWSLE